MVVISSAFTMSCVIRTKTEPIYARYDVTARLKNTDIAFLDKDKYQLGEIKFSWHGLHSELFFIEKSNTTPTIEEIREVLDLVYDRLY